MAAGSSWRRAHAEGERASTVGSWVEVVRRARLALASEIVGVAERMLEVATDQVSGRRQFGRPIGTYQAIRHRLAEAYSELAGARSLVAMAWEDGRAEAAGWAKIVAGSAHATVTKHTTQVCGAIGLHEEHALPALVRRGFVLDALLGSALAQRSQMGREGLAAPLPDPVGTF
jgi:alkylation response protein AidB-like acyl-CoA dehydrogenase